MDIRKNRFSSLSVRVSAFFSAVFLSLLCGLFYNAWKYEVERIVLEEGGWQSRIEGELDGGQIEAIKNFAHVKEVVENGDTTDLYFQDYRAVVSDTPRIAEQLGISPERVAYNYELLAMYLVRGEGDPAPRLLFPMFLLILALASFSLIVIIHNAFALSMNARIRQIGIFSSIGATPAQIRACLLREAAALCIVPVLTGNLLGIAGCVWVTELSNLLLGNEIQGRHRAVPGYHPLVLLATVSVTAATIWVSAWLPAGKLSRLTPLQAIKNTGELQLKRRKTSCLPAFFFGVCGELAGNALKAQRKALRTASISLVFSFLAFTIMQCFFTLSGISTRETYFERYQDAWDVMVTAGDVEIDTFEETEAIRGLAGVETVTVYQRAAAKRIVTEEELSEEMKAFGGFSHASEYDVTRAGKGWLVNAPVLILDDYSFLAYCRQIGVEPRLDGAVVRNQIRDVTNADFRHPDFLPYLSVRGGENAVSVLRQSGNVETTAEIPVLSYTDKVPVLREEYASYDSYELVHFLPVSLWRDIKGQIGGTEGDVRLNILGRKDATSGELDAIGEAVCRLIGQGPAVKYENRIRESETNERQIGGMKAVFGGFCALLALIGLGNVFSNTLGFVRQRRREFARYLSVGMTPGEIRRMFCLEALALAGRPILLTLPPAVIAAGYMLKRSYVAPKEFLAEMPVVPIVLFMLAIAGFVALAYFLSWRNMRNIYLAEVLKDDTMI